MPRRVTMLCFGLVIFLVPALGGTPAESVEQDIVGQVLSNSAMINGAPMPSGSTLLNPSVIATALSPAIIHLTNGQVVELARNSSAAFEKTQEGEIHITVKSGTLIFRAAEGEIATLPPESELAVTPSGQLQPLTSLVRGVVAVLAEAAHSGQRALQVNDVAKIDPSQSILVRRQGETLGEVHHIRSIHGLVIQTKGALQRSFEPNTLIIQGEEVEKAIAAGAVVVGATVASGIGSGATIAAVGAAGATAVGLATVVGSNNTGNENLSPASSSSPPPE